MLFFCLFYCCCYYPPILLSTISCLHLFQNAKSLSSSDSLAKVQEVASWLLEMNQDLLSGGSGSRAAQQQRPGAAAAGNSTSGRTPQPQAEHMNRVLEEQEQEAQQQRRELGEEEEAGQERPREAEEEPWPSGGEPVEEGRRNEVNGADKGAQWMWDQRHRRHCEEEEENEVVENNNAGREGQVGVGLRSEEDDDRPEDEEDGEEEMDQDSDEFEHSEESGREEEEEAEDDEEGLHSPSHRTSVSDLNDNTDQSSGRQHQSSPSVCKNKVRE